MELMNKINKAHEKHADIEWKMVECKANHKEAEQALSVMVEQFKKVEKEPQHLETTKKLQHEEIQTIIKDKKELHQDLRDLKLDQKF